MRDERARGMRVSYELNDFRRGIVLEAFYKLDQVRAFALR